MSQRELLAYSSLLGVVTTMTLLSLTLHQWHSFGISALLTILMLIGMIVRADGDGPLPPQGAGSA